MKLNRVVSALTAGLAAAVLSGTAAAAPVLEVTLTDGVNTVVIGDTGTGLDLSAAGDGIVNVNTTVGNWTIVAALSSWGDNPFEFHLLGGVTAKAGTGPALTIKSTLTDINGSGPTTFNFTPGLSSGPAGSDVSWAIYEDNLNAKYGTGTTLFSGNGFTLPAGSITANVNDPYSLTMTSTFDYSKVTGTGFKTASLDLNLSIPEPSSVALVGAALLGLGAAASRRKA